MEQIVIKSLPEWDALAEHLLMRLKAAGPWHSGVVVVLTGDLGAGKTTFTQAFARRLGVVDVVQSPTFTIMKRYETTDPDFTTLVHMDAYRIEALDELGPLGLPAAFKTPGVLFCIEWGERIASVLPRGTITMAINHEQDDVRIVTISGGYSA